MLQKGQGLIRKKGNKDTRHNRRILPRGKEHWFFKSAALLSLGEQSLKSLQDKWGPTNYRTFTRRRLSRIACALDSGRVSTDKYLSVRSAVGQSFARKNKRMSDALVRLSGGLLAKKLYNSKKTLNSVIARIAASNVYVFMTLQHIFARGIRPVAEANARKVTWFDRRSTLFSARVSRMFLYRALAQAAVFGSGSPESGSDNWRGLLDSKGRGPAIERTMRSDVLLIRLGGFNVDDLEKGSRLVMKKLSKSAVRGGAYNLPSGVDSGERSNVVQHLLAVELAEARGGTDVDIPGEEGTTEGQAAADAEYESISTALKKEVEGSLLKTSALGGFTRKRAEKVNGKNTPAVAQLKAYWDVFCEINDAEDLSGLPAVFPESDRHVTATIFNKLNQKYSGRDRLDTDDSMHKVKYNEDGFEENVRSYFFEKFRKDPIYNDRVLQLLISVLTREGKLVRMQKIFNDLSRRAKFAAGEKLEKTFNDALKELRPTYANYLHVKGRSREIMPRPITFHQAVSLSLRFFKRKLISKDSRNAALKSVKTALIGEVDNHFAEYKARNSFFEDYIEQSKQNAYLVAGYKAMRDRLEDERVKEYRIRVGAVAVRNKERSRVKSYWLSRAVMDNTKMHISKHKMIDGKLNLDYVDPGSVNALEEFDLEKAKKRSQWGRRRGGGREIKKLKK